MLMSRYADLARGLLLAGLFAAAGLAGASMTPIEDEHLAEVTGQALFVADKVNANSLAGAGGSGSTTDFTFYRIGLDAILEMNLNIDKLQLGCGGVNDALVAGVCDIDLDNVRFMGRCTAVGCGQTVGGFKQSGSGDAVTSDFKLLRPYLELAIKNDGSKTQREVVGIKIGTQSADGWVGTGSFVGGVHTGINAISGFLNAELSAYIRVNSTFGRATVCAGIPAGHEAQCAGSPTGATFPVPAARTSGTRQTRLQVPDVPLCCLSGESGIIGLFNGSTLFLNLDENLNFLHGFELANTGDFFISMQRQQVKYPKYDKSGYAVTANTGWWMNIPQAKLVNLEPPEVTLPCSGFICLGLFGAFGSPGLGQSNIELGSRPVDNCFGATGFC